ncbi:bifunctional hydroxymethylpyrimidine kinase/phosphomethylpyrimidine kinase [Paenibacillus sp. NFR01]|uniref:bifunctional hydroxymethylpyrimidine kinase/phosphomethylpyrimidine kinase n=1 Tax=Paenibacillus sp. NFR01 TaxID=1566279 RepID=UPI0008BDA49D|nr:bifunctional hydroxymethylpyrimidine kinase/phosphomethylpyrimidine kinase [Paenibacillus sp. NFR01]SET34494.1 hydroxymethylpyrimidine/phosphomethylpyrimidine kinase [Paenibacillus sp. NFR01]
MVAIRKALTVAGSDSGGGAGIQADLKTFQELGVYGMSAITAVTAQNTLGVQGVFPLQADAVKAQLESIAADLAPDALKTGMLFNSEIIRTVAGQVRAYGWDKLVVDPVMVAKGGAALLQPEAVDALVGELLPLALVVTPNIPEAELLSGMPIVSIQDRKAAARIIHAMGPGYVLLKGGHGPDSETVTDLLYDGTGFTALESPRIPTRHTHGTGCTYSAALTAALAGGASVPEAANLAKAFISAAIGDGLGIGSGHGPTNHFAFRNRQVRERG